MEEINPEPDRLKTALIYHNPRCSKSRAALSLLQDHDLGIEVVEYLEQTPSAKELAELCRMLGVSPTAIVRSKESRFEELGLSMNDERTEAEWCRLLSENPVLLERPIVRIGDHAVVGRPPENVLKLLEPGT